MSKNNLVERQKTADAKRQKTKVRRRLKWKYVTEPFDVYVNPKQVKRIHALLEKSLTFEPEYQGYCLHLRPCVQGVDEDGEVVKYLYCTRDGRFFVRGKDGWNELKPKSITPKGAKRGGSTGIAMMRYYGCKLAHRCVAVAWCNPPKEALAEINDRHIKKKWEVDHLNTDHANWTADNLQWVTPEENRRRGKIARRMRKIGLDPKRLMRTLLLGIYSLPEERIGEFIGRFLMACNDCGDPMDMWSIRMCVAIALDIMRVPKAAVDGSGQLLTTNNPS